MAIALGLLLGALGVADLVRRPGDHRAALDRPAIAGTVFIVLGLVLAGAGWHATWLAPLGVLIVLLWLWGQWRQNLIALAGTALALLTVLIFGQYLRWYDAPISGWYNSLEVPGLNAVSFEQAVLGLGAVLFLLQSSNVVVRVVLGEAGPQVLAQENLIKGGRIIGPLERVFIFAMALIGQYAAAAALIAAKGIVRFPEISQDEKLGFRAEYFLVGSFASWAMSFGFVLLF